jgi:hypothetical protein
MSKRIDLTVRLEKTECGDVSVVIIPGEGASEEQASYFASALGDVLDWDELYADMLDTEGQDESEQVDAYALMSDTERVEFMRGLLNGDGGDEGEREETSER